MPAPGVNVNLLSSAIRSNPASDTSTAFMIGIADRGPTTVATKVQSLEEFVTTYGDRVSAFSALYDAANSFFEDGGNVAYIGRVIGPAPVSGTVNLFDASGSTAPGDVSLLATAITPGDWAAGFSVSVIAGDAGGEFKVRVFEGSTIVETSTSLVDRAAAVAWSAGSDYLRLTLGASAEDPRVQAAVAFAGGDDDRDSTTDATWDAALGLFSRSYGPGQVLAPGRFTKEQHASLAAHATLNNRVAIGDLDDVAYADLLVDIGESRAECDTDDLKRIALFGSTLETPGVSSGTTREIAPSGNVSGMIARMDASGNSPNLAAAGKNGISNYAIGLTRAGEVEYTEDERAALNDAGVNIHRLIDGTVRLYGYRTLVDSSVDGAWTSFANSRLLMAIQNRAEIIAENYVFEQIDGKGILFGQLQGELMGMLSEYYDQKSLFGDTPQDAFIVDVGSAVNTPETIAAGEVHAKLYVRMSPTAEFVTIDIIRVSALDTI